MHLVLCMVMTCLHASPRMVAGASSQVGDMILLPSAPCTQRMHWGRVSGGCLWNQQSQSKHTPHGAEWVGTTDLLRSLKRRE